MEFLKEVLSEETYAKFLEETKDKDLKLANLKDGGYVSVEKYNTAVTDLDTTKAELASRTNDLTKLSESAETSEATKLELERIKGEFEQKEADYQKKLETNQREAIVDRFLLEQGTIDLVASKAHLGNAIYENELKDGAIVGLHELVAQQKEEKSYLYDKTIATGKGHKKTPVEEKSLEQVLRDAMK